MGDAREVLRLRSERHEGAAWVPACTGKTKGEGTGSGCGMTEGGCRLARRAEAPAAAMISRQPAKAGRPGLRLSTVGVGDV